MQFLFSAVPQLPELGVGLGNNPGFAAVSVAPILCLDGQLSAWQASEAPSARFEVCLECPGKGGLPL